MFGKIYNGRKVFITGHTGFKGSWLCAWLLSLGARVTGFSKAIPTTPSSFEALGLHDQLTDLRGDVRDGKAVAEAIQQSGAEIVFHLAAQALVRESYEHPVETFETNMLGPLHVLEACRHAPHVRAVVIITSDKCYRNDEWVWGYREIDRLGGADPYSASKACAELISQSFFKSFFQSGAACATARAGNVIGGGDWARDRIVPDCARAWSAGEAVRIRSPHATRPWQHVLEPLSGYLWLGARLMNNNIAGETAYNPRGESFNFGPATDMDNPVSEVAKGLAYYWPGFTSEMDAANHAAKKESTLLKLCCDKSLAWLNWKATLGFDETIRYTAEWYARYYAGNNPDMLAFTNGQIAAYSNSALERGLLWAKN